jgi:serine phosphatase RsbU (regulator of sigma subunit)
MALTPRRSGVLWRFLVRPLLLAIPFALFFSYLVGEGMQSIGAYYIASLYFSFLITLFVEANRRWIAPRVVPADHPRPGPPHPLQIASYAMASVFGSVAAGLALRFTIAPNTLGTERDVVLFLLFTLIFAGLFLGVIYASRMKHLYVRRIREETREEQEMKIAAEIQQALLPPRIHAGETHAAAAASVPCRAIGGDFFEYFDLPGARVGFALGDVAGKGPSAAILASLVQGILSTHEGDGGGPAATLHRVNQALCRRGIESRFATLAYMVLDPGGKLVSSSAGHNPAFLIGRDGGVRRLERGGLVLGAFEDAAYEEETVDLAPGDTFVLFSDGVSDAESPSGEQFGEARLQSLLAGGAARGGPEQILERVLGAVRAFAADRPPADDITVLVVRYLGPRGNPPTS